MINRAFQRITGLTNKELERAFTKQLVDISIYPNAGYGFRFFCPHDSFSWYGRTLDTYCTFCEIGLDAYRMIRYWSARRSFKYWTEIV